MQTCSSGSPSSEDAAPVVGQRAPKSRWTPADEDTLLQYLLEHRPISDPPSSNVMFKDQIFQEAAEVVNAKQFSGALKTMDSCKAKWKNVHFSHSLSYLFLPVY
jgi:hypothetical protein